MTIRPATDADARAIAIVHVESWRAGYRGLVADDVLERLDVDEREERWHEWIAEAPVLVADERGAIAGFVAFRAETGEVAALYVAPARTRHGIGRALLEAAHAALREAGRDEATLWVLVGNADALAFYAALGYEPDGARMVHERTGVDQVRLWTGLDRR